MIIYDWGTRRSHLAFHLWPEARVIPADPEHTASQLAPLLEREMPADAAFLFHLNVTFSSFWPSDRSALLHWLESRRVRPLNARLVDISKRRIQALNQQLGIPSVRAGRDTPPDTLVIIKTDRNYGGGPERALSGAQRARLGMTLGNPRITRFDQYEICEAARVTESDWSDPLLVVERYVRNSRHAYYRCYFAGEYAVLSEAINPRPIQKMLTGLPRSDWCLGENDPALPEALKRLMRNCELLRHAMGLDFGTMDVMMDDAGTAYIVDVNATPAWGDESQPHIIEHLRRGFGSLHTPR